MYLEKKRKILELCVNEHLIYAKITYGSESSAQALVLFETTKVANISFKHK